MRILEMKFVSDLCKNADLKVVSSKQTLGGVCSWLFIPNNRTNPMSSAKLSSDEHSFILTFTYKGRQAHTTFDMSLNLKSEDTGMWEPSQEKDKEEYIAAIRNIYPKPLDDTSQEIDKED